jgi:hypothetical protein
MSETLTTLWIDASTGVSEIKDFTAQEIADREQLQAESVAMQAEAQAKADARASALAKLADLGLTQDEINAL